MQMFFNSGLIYLIYGKTKMLLKLLFLELQVFLLLFLICSKRLFICLFIKSIGYSFSNNKSLIRLRLLSWKRVSAKLIHLSTKEQIIPILLLTGWWGLKFKNLPQKVGFLYQYVEIFC